MSRNLVGITDQEADALNAALQRIEIDGKRVVGSVEAFGSRAGSTYRGRPPLPDSDLDVYIIMKSEVVNFRKRWIRSRIFQTCLVE